METIGDMLAALSPADQRLVLDGIGVAAEHLHLAARTLTDTRYHEEPDPGLGRPPPRGARRPGEGDAGTRGQFPRAGSLGRDRAGGARPDSC